MEHGFHNASLTVGLAMVCGIAAQAVARKLKLPGIVILLILGVVVGPDVLHLVEPSALGSGLQVLVGFAVAIILFEGGMALNIKRLLRAQKAVRNLVTIGALVTMIGGTLAARYGMGWSWMTSLLFGTLVIVTGPTVITPLLRRLKVEHRVATVLEAEGVLIDAVGAITAAVAVEVALYPTQASVTAAFINAGGGLSFGVAFGILAGLLLVEILKRDVLPGNLENVFTLSYVLALFQLSNTFVHESGIAAVTVAGIVVGRTSVSKELHEFKEQLTNLVIGMLFVLLAADVRMSEVRALGMPGVITVLAMMFLVRPANVLVGTWGSDLSWRQRLFMSWIGPRGIIAAAVASLFAVKLDAGGLPGGSELRALVFLVIASTVLAAGLTGGLVAQVLGLRRKVNNGWIIIGAHSLGRMMAKAMTDHGESVVVIDSDPDAIVAAEKVELRVVFGNALEPRTLQRAGLDARRGVLAMTSREEANFLLAQKVRAEAKDAEVLMVLDSMEHGVTEEMVEKLGGHVLFGSSQAADLWSVRIRRGMTSAHHWLCDAEEPIPAKSLAEHGMLPMLIIHEGHVEPVSSVTEFKAGDELLVLVLKDRREAEAKHLESLGFVRAEPASIVL